MSDRTEPKRATLTQIALTAANAKILGVAIKRGAVMFWSPKPDRHHDLIKKMVETGVTKPIGHRGDVRGFQTIDGFATRMDAARMIGADWPLFSEDLW